MACWFVVRFVNAIGGFYTSLAAEGNNHFILLTTLYHPFQSVNVSPYYYRICCFALFNHVCGFDLIFCNYFVSGLVANLKIENCSDVGTLENSVGGSSKRTLLSNSSIIGPFCSSILRSFFLLVNFVNLSGGWGVLELKSQMGKT